jgi:cysteine desulfurase
VFTSGATESDNLAIRGVAERYRSKGRHIVTAVHEHHAVVDPCHRLEQRGCEVTWLGPLPGGGGAITAAQVAAAMRADTVLVSIMWANNEVGTISEAPAIGALCRERGVLFHSDATQFVGKLPVDVGAAKIDLLSGTAHKFYGPKGTGFLYVRGEGPRVELEPLFEGGGQERGMRSGTLNVPGIVGLGRAAELCRELMPEESKRMALLRDRLEKALLAGVPGSRINGHPTLRLPHTCNISLAGVDSAGIIAAMPDLAVSAGAACNSGSATISYVLKAIGVPEELGRGAVRFSVGRFTTEDEIDWAIQRVLAAVELQKASGAAVGCGPS